MAAKEATWDRASQISESPDSENSVLGFFSLAFFFKAFFHMTCDGQGLQRLLAASEAGRVLEAGTRRRAGQRGSSEPRNRG